MCDDDDHAPPLTATDSYSASAPMITAAQLRSPHDVLTSVDVVLRACRPLYECKDLLQLVESFIDAPSRWRTFKIPMTETLALCRSNSRANSRAARAGSDPMTPPASGAHHTATHIVTQEGKDLHRALLCAASRGHLHILQWLDANHRTAQVSRRVMDTAAAFGQFAVVQWLHTNRPEGCTDAAMTCACEAGRLDIAQWLFEHRTEGCAPWTLRWSLHRGDLDVATWLSARQLGGTCDGSDLDDAAEKGRLDVVKFILRTTHGSSSSSGTGIGIGATLAMDKAAERGHLDIVQFLHKHRVDGCTTNAMDLAAANGHLDVVVFLHEHRREGCTTQAMDLAARGGHMRVVRWLQAFRREGCTVEAMNSAARSNNLAMVQYLHRVRSEGCTEAALQGAVLAQNVEMLTWLYGHYPHLFTCVAVQRGIHIANNRKFIEVTIALLEIQAALRHLS